MEVRSDEFRPLFSGPTAAERPLFGTTNTRDRVVNLVVGFGSALLFVVTLLSAFLAQSPPRGVNIYLVFCISLILLSHVVLIYWYRQGDLDPKFRILIYYNAFTLVLLSSCALSIFYSEK